MDDFTPSTVPGCRTPHVWLDDGRSLYDALGPGYTLLRFDSGHRRASVAGRGGGARRAARAARRRARRARLAALTPKLVLSRPDQHVAWRGDRVPDDPDALIDTITGVAASLN